MNLSYERMLHLLAIASIEIGDSCLDYLQLKESEVTDRDISIKFSDYVKSQIHYYMINKVNNKSFFKFVNAFYYLNGNIKYRNDALELVRCFYQDITTFLLHSSLDLHISLTIDIDIRDTWEADVSQVKSEISEMFQLSDKYTSEQFKEYLDSSKYSWILDYVDSIEKGKQRIDNYALAFSLSEMLKDPKLYKFKEVVHEN